MGGLFDCCIEPEETSTNAKNALLFGENKGKGYISWVWRRKFQEAYQLGPILGQGSFAVVHEVIDVSDGLTYAAKIVSRHRLRSANDLRHFQSEVRILQDISHPNIIQLHELYKTPDHFFVVTELLHGGELFQRLCEKDVYTEMEARNVVRTVFEAVAFLHEHGIAHRDLKPENLLLVSRTDDMRVKIADFGFAIHVKSYPNSLVTLCGSPPFMAPEIVNHQNYDERVDNWSLGVIVFYLLGGYNPFHRESVRATYQQIRQGAYRFDPEDWDGISPDAKNMIRSLLMRDVNKRSTAQLSLRHPWMTGRGDDLKQNRVNLEKMKLNVVKTSGPVRSVSMFWLISRK